MPAKKKTTQKKSTKKHPVKKTQTKTKVVYRTKYVERSRRRRSEEDDPLNDSSRLIRSGMGLMIGASLIGAVGRSLNNV